MQEHTNLLCAAFVSQAAYGLQEACLKNTKHEPETSPLKPKSIAYIKE